MSILTAILEARQRRQAIHDLRSMPSAVLADIGIEPDQIEDAVAALGRSKRGSAPPVYDAVPLPRTAWPYVWSR